MGEPVDYLVAGQEALGRGAWVEARGAFEAALAEAESAEALEGLGFAAGWLDDGAAAIPAYERAYRLYQQGGNALGAGRAATALADHYYLFRGQLQVAMGWLHRARSLLHDIPLAPEHGMLAAEAGFITYQGAHDVVAAGRFGAEAAACGRALGIPDLTMYGMAMEGLAKVSSGDIEAGMAMLDEASVAATSGEVADAGTANVICCYLIYACEWAHDFRRAAEWCERLKAYIEQVDMPVLLGICRSHYAGVLMWQGAWKDAEEHLNYATEVLGPARPVLAGEAHVRMGELRRRQGRWAEAEALFAQAEHEARTPVARAALELDRGDPLAAIEWAERLLRRLDPESRIERMTALDIVARGRVALGQVDAADEVVSEMWYIASVVRTGAARARALAAEGICAAVRGDHEHARRCLEDAADLFHEGEGQFESACARTDLASSLLALGRSEAALRELDRAAETFSELGAAHHLDRVRALQRTLTRDNGTAPGGLTPRECEVLKLVAEGLSNQAIADELVLSVRTVERHLATIYEKLQLEGRNARAAAVGFALREGIAQR